MSDGPNREGFAGLPYSQQNRTAGLEVTHDPEIPVRLVQLHLCDPCLDGMGGECHTPGCSLWINRAPDLAIRNGVSVVILDEPQPAPDLGAAYADLESEIRVAVSLHCTGPGVPCDLCLRETDRAMKAVDVYARDVAQHERTREQPAPEPHVCEPLSVKPSDDAKPAPELVQRLANALGNRQVLVFVGEIAEPHTLARPYDLAVQLLTAIDARLTDDVPQPAPELADQVARGDRLEGKIEDISAERDKAYRERAALVAYLAAAYPAEITPAESDSGAWFLIFVTTPTGQMSWHLHEDDLDLFEPLLNAPETGIEWDGHTTDEKYERLAELTRIVGNLRQPRPQPAPELAEPVLVLADGEVIATRAYDGGAIVIAFAPGAPLGRAAEMRDAMAAQCDVPVFAVADVAAVRAWQPPLVVRDFLTGRELSHQETTHDRGEIRTCYCGTTATVVPGVFPHHDCDGSVQQQPQPAPELAAAIQDVIDRYPEREPAPELAAAMADPDLDESLSEAVALERERADAAEAQLTETRRQVDHLSAALAGDNEADPQRPLVVCLCGSTRFYAEFQQANYDLTMRGAIVLSVGFYPHAAAVHGHGEGVGHDSAEKTALDELHKRKIDMADEVLVVSDAGGYFGQSTAGEVAYAVAHGKPVRFAEPAAEKRAWDLGLLEDQARAGEPS